MADEQPVTYSTLGIPITPSKHRLPKLPWWLWVVLGFVVLAVVGAIVGPQESDSSARSDNGQQVGARRLGAFDVCKQFVGERLKSPGSAKWRDPFGDQVIYSGNGDGPITVMASVDSQNGFGALLRTSYACTVSRVSGTSWHLDSLDGI